MSTSPLQAHNTWCTQLEGTKVLLGSAFLRIPCMISWVQGRNTAEGTAEHCSTQDFWEAESRARAQRPGTASTVVPMPCPGRPISGHQWLEWQIAERCYFLPTSKAWAMSSNIDFESRDHSRTALSHQGPSNLCNDPFLDILQEPFLKHSLPKWG